MWNLCPSGWSNAAERGIRASAWSSTNITGRDGSFCTARKSTGWNNCTWKQFWIPLVSFFTCTSAVLHIPWLHIALKKHLLYADIVSSHLDKSGHSQVGTACLFCHVFVFPENVLRNRLHQSLHAAQVGRVETLGSGKLHKQSHARLYKAVNKHIQCEVW